MKCKNFKDYKSGKCSIVSHKHIKTFIFWFGLFLVLDGVLSIWFGNSCLNQCANNNTFGNIVRIIRGIGGLILIILSFTRLRWKQNAKKDFNIRTEDV